VSDEQDRLFREYLKEEHQDDTMHYLTPSSPSALASLTNTEVQRLYRKVAFANYHPWDRQVELELIGRLTAELERFSKASSRASSRLEVLTWTLLGLTGVIVVLTVALFFRG
jgi:hypothetical protein